MKLSLRETMNSIIEDTNRFIGLKIQILLIDKLSCKYDFSKQDAYNLFKISDSDLTFYKQYNKRETISKKPVELKQEFKTEQQLKKEKLYQLFGSDEESETEYEDDDEDVVIDVTKFNWKGITYLKSDDGTIYDINTQTAIGYWNSFTDSIEFEEFEDSE